MDELLGPARSLLIWLLAFLLLFLVAGEDGAPGGPLFALLFVFLSATLAGLAAKRLSLPPLMGMLSVGILLRNVPYVGPRVGGRLDGAWSAAIRLLALSFIICRAGLAFDLEALKRLRFVVARLCALPSLTETAIITILAVLLLDFPLQWAALLGFIVAAISPAVVVPCLLSLQDQGYGTSSGIPTMIVAAAALDDMLAISGFGICLSFTREAATTPLWLDVARAPLELAAGMACGVVGGGIVWKLAPAGEKVSNDGVALLLALNFVSAFGLKRLGMSCASAISVLVISIGAAKAWGTAATKPVSALMNEGWNRLAQPVLFGFVGCSVAFDALEPRLVGIGLLMLLVSLPARCAVAYLAVGGQKLSSRERLFTAVAWLPKATVQAAIGATALDEATTEAGKKNGREVVAIAVLSILATAPLGAVVITYLGPRLLKKDTGEAANIAVVPEEPAAEPAAEPFPALEEVKVREEKQKAKCCGLPIWLGRVG